jgi:hypothetical protein
MSRPVDRLGSGFIRGQVGSQTATSSTLSLNHNRRQGRPPLLPRRHFLIVSAINEAHRDLGDAAARTLHRRCGPESGMWTGMSLGPPAVDLGHPVRSRRPGQDEIAHRNRTPAARPPFEDLKNHPGNWNLKCQASCALDPLLLPNNVSLLSLFNA